LKVLVVGYGSIGKRHVKNLLAITDIQIIICTKQKISNPSPKRIMIFNSITECIKEEPNIGIISNESSFHMEVAIKLAKADIDLFIEKPLSNSLKGTKQLSSIIKQKKIITQIGCQLRFHKCIKKIKELVSSNKIGKIISVRAESGSFLPDWHPGENYKKSYAAKNELGGGVTLTNIHEIDYLYWLFGEVKEIHAVTGRYSKLGIDSDDLSVAILKFKKNIVGELHLDYFQKPDFRSCKIIGSEGVIYWDSDSNIVSLYENKKEKWIKVLKWTKYDRNSMFKDELIHFLNSVKKRQLTINPVEKDGIITLKIALGISKSSKSRKMIKI